MSGRMGSGMSALSLHYVNTGLGMGVKEKRKRGMNTERLREVQGHRQGQRKMVRGELLLSLLTLWGPTYLHNLFQECTRGGGSTGQEK